MKATTSKCLAQPRLKALTPHDLKHVIVHRLAVFALYPLCVSLGKVALLAVQVSDSLDWRADENFLPENTPRGTRDLWRAGRHGAALVQFITVAQSSFSVPLCVSSRNFQCMGVGAACFDLLCLRRGLFH